MKRVTRTDEGYLSRCLELAEQGRGFVSPNPHVGCVIVRKGKTIAEGYHRKFGGDHAEVIALRKAGDQARGGTLYVNLEPCSHYGKTPPCTDAIIRAGIRKVVLARKDPNHLVSGRGIRALRKAGIEVRVGVKQNEARGLNQEFFHFHTAGIPFVSLKVAQTLDGRMADVKGRSKWITSAIARKEAHRLRSMHDAVLVGAGTVRRDNPELTVRQVSGRNPVRIILDGAMSTPLHAKVFSSKVAPTIVFTRRTSLERKASRVIALERRGVQVYGIDAKEIIPLSIVLRILGEMKISSVLVEGGGATISEFLKEKIGDRLYWFMAPSILGGGLSSVMLNPARSVVHPIRVTTLRSRQVGPDLLVEGEIRFR